METNNFKLGDIYNISDLSKEIQDTLKEGKLFYTLTRTVEQFKDDQKVEKLRVRKNEKTSKLFFTYGSATGSVAAKGIPSHPMVSHVIGLAKDKSGNIIPGKATCFALLHEEGTGSAPVIAEF